MKTKIYSLFAILMHSVSAWSQGVGVNETGANPDPSAILDASSTTKGFLPPRMTHAQKNAISNPAAGLIIWCSNCGESGEIQVFNGTEWANMVGGVASEPDTYPAGYVHCNPSNPTAIVDVTNGFTGKTWMDRNLGANRVAISSTDAEAYGSLFQWGRFADGHQCVNRYAGDGVTTSGTTSTLSSSDTPGHGDFITTSSAPYDWRSPQNNSLWQGVSGTNNPCPTGYRLPTETELNNERLSWVLAPISSTNTSAGAFASPLKLPMAGLRDLTNGSLGFVGSFGAYWSSTVSSTFAQHLYCNNSNAGMINISRGFGLSVRCIKD